MTTKLQQDVGVIKGIGTETEKKLNGLGIFTVKDLIGHLPFRYEDFKVSSPEELEHQERGTLQGVVQETPVVRYYGKKKNRLTVRMLVGYVLVTVVVFNRAYLKNQLEPGTTISATGKWDKHRLILTAQYISKEEMQESSGLEPVYASTANVSVRHLKQWIQTALHEAGHEMEDLLPSALKEAYKLPDIVETMHEIHQPTDRIALKHARRRIVYEEFFLFQLSMLAYRKKQKQEEPGTPLKFEESLLRAFIAELPFSLTSAQQQVIRDILADMALPARMNRLLQGDVGSGKTVVAMIAMYAAVIAGKQAAFMVPTSILAEQHAKEIEERLTPYGIRTSLLTGGRTEKQRKETYQQLAGGEIDIIIGTHALIQPEVPFRDLGLVITDEQHRFGVKQRRTLRDKGQHPDILFMTATPIPRTLSISVFGDMDVSKLNELPAGRKPIETYWAKPAMLERIVRFLDKEINQGRQAYVICPLIEESEQLDVQNALDIHAELEEMLPHQTVGLMHGRLPQEEKEEVMRAFSAGETSLLVSTTVVEVGVNVPNATVMVISDADRFGLAQLHQLRGRVGRGSEQAYCILIADPKTEQGQERMRIMTETSDGFELSERDLKLRGPGDFFGNKQSGMPSFKMADPVHDYRALETARSDADKLVNSASFWEHPDYKALREYLEEKGALEHQTLD
ncbi:ATP-dependent DNA helicase RecG [Salsuginibacillus kocurii]|uniref:ATP-dependent DNA helicase RecG n=1 Tax=Salsuginibacillus kocurii TaxID=427078 RepID=UPI000367CE05|nr:ATP-dependent DNA helicase RecG [Salsuginibacillus kocurii]